MLAALIPSRPGADSVTCQLARSHPSSSGRARRPTTCNPSFFSGSLGFLPKMSLALAVPARRICICHCFSENDKIVCISSCIEHCLFTVPGCLSPIFLSPVLRLSSNLVLSPLSCTHVAAPGQTLGVDGLCQCGNDFCQCDLQTGVPCLCSTSVGVV